VQRYQAGSGNQINQTLKTPELYDMTVDVGESYDVAANHPNVVTDLQRRIAEKLRTFPEEIRKANADLLK
jgi:prefoldin subunit 5